MVKRVVVLHHELILKVILLMWIMWRTKWDTNLEETIPSHLAMKVEQELKWNQEVAQQLWVMLELQERLTYSQIAIPTFMQDQLNKLPIISNQKLARPISILEMQYLRQMQVLIIPFQKERRLY